MKTREQITEDLVGLCRRLHDAELDRLERTFVPFGFTPMGEAESYIRRWLDDLADEVNHRLACGCWDEDEVTGEWKRIPVLGEEAAT